MQASILTQTPTFSNSNNTHHSVILQQYCGCLQQYLHDINCTSNLFVWCLQVTPALRLRVGAVPAAAAGLRIDMRTDSYFTDASSKDKAAGLGIPNTRAAYLVDPSAPPGFTRRGFRRTTVRRACFCFHRRRNCCCRRHGRAAVYGYLREPGLDGRSRSYLLRGQVTTRPPRPPLATHVIHPRLAHPPPTTPTTRHWQRTVDNRLLFPPLGRHAPLVLAKDIDVGYYSRSGSTATQLTNTNRRRRVLSDGCLSIYLHVT